MPSRQQQCEKGLREWRRAFLAIRQPRSKVEAVNRLCQFALEMRAYWPDTTLPGNGPSAAGVQAEPFTLPPPIPLDAVMVPPKPVLEPEGLIDFPGVVHVTVTEAPPPVNFPGILEGAGAPVFPKAADPDVEEITVYAYCPNPRLLSGKLASGKLVSVWKGPHAWRLPCKKLCRKDAASPNYTPV